MHVMFGHSTYGKTRIRALITTPNHIGVSTSYNDNRKSRNLLSSYAVLASKSEGTPIPSHFTKTDFCIGAMDNSDYADNSSLSGTHSKHYTAMLLFQEAVNKPAAKPPISSAGLKPSQHPDLMLPCQIVPHVMKPVIRPSLPADLTLIENCNLVSIKPEQAAINASQIEFLLFRNSSR